MYGIPSNTDPFSLNENALEIIRKLLASTLKKALLIIQYVSHI